MFPDSYKLAGNVGKSSQKNFRVGSYLLHRVKQIVYNKRGIVVHLSSFEKNEYSLIDNTLFYDENTFVLILDK